MPSEHAISRFEGKLYRPASPGDDRSWTFLLLPKEVSDTLPRRGRTTIEGTLNGHWFQATVEPDGQLSHWLKVSKELKDSAGAKVGDVVAVRLSAVEVEPEPEVPTDLLAALGDSPHALRVWDATTTMARLDWIHWIVSAKQVQTRAKRIHDACDMLSQGKKRVCCFDPSGFYSKAFRAPEPAEDQEGE
jgi:hypothetical protein